MKLLLALAALVLCLLQLTAARMPPRPIDASLAGACNDAQDLKGFKLHNGTFTAAMQSCATGCLGGADCSAACIQKYVGLTRACANCFGGDVACTATNCTWACLSPSSKACVECSLKHCETPLLACAGVPKSALPV